MKKYQSYQNSYGVFDLSTNYTITLSRKFGLKYGFMGDEDIKIFNCSLGKNFTFDGMTDKPIEKIEFRDSNFSGSVIRGNCKNLRLHNVTYSSDLAVITGGAYVDITVHSTIGLFNVWLMGNNVLDIASVAHFDFSNTSFYGTTFRTFETQEGHVDMFFGSHCSSTNFTSCKFEYGVFQNVTFIQANFVSCESGDFHLFNGEPKPAFKGCTFRNCTFDGFQSRGDKTEKVVIFEDCTFTNCHNFKEIDKARFKNCKWES